MVAILKYNAGNVTSVENAINRLGFETIITDDFTTLRRADKVIFPGVGHANFAMQYLKEKSLDKLLLSLNQPVLGICLGMQLMCRFTEEGDTEGLGIFDVSVKHFPAEKLVPHMGWNNFETLDGSLFQGIEAQNDFYFVHSYYAELCEATIAKTNYILHFSAALQKDNFYAVQFHPEKSAQNGTQLLNNFLNL